MKLLFKTLGAGLVLGALLLAGCAAEKKSLPNLDSAPSDVQIKALVGLDLALNAELTLIAGTDPGVDGVTATFSQDLTTVTIELDAYDDGNGNSITGEVIAAFHGQEAISLSGSLSISGVDASTVSFALTVTSSKVSGTFTVDGAKYSFSVTPSSSSISGIGKGFKKKS